MVGTYGKDPVALKQCLHGDALNVVKGVEDEYETMLKRLDEKFGNRWKIVVIIADL